MKERDLTRTAVWSHQGSAWARSGYVTLINVVDSLAPIRLPRHVFETLVGRVDAAVRDHAIALALQEDLSLRALVLVSPEGFDSSGLGVDDPIDVLDSLDHLLFYAFEDAPASVVREWVLEDDDQLRREAIDRVEFVRSNMPHLSELWGAKSSSVVPPLTGLDYEISYDQNGRAVAAVLYLSAGRVTFLGKPNSADTIRLRIKLWPADVQMLIGQLESIRHTGLAHTTGAVGDD